MADRDGDHFRKTSREGRFKLRKTVIARRTAGDLGLLATAGAIDTNGLPDPAAVSLLAAAGMNIANLVNLTYYATRAIDFPILVQLRLRRWAVDPAPSVTAIAVVALTRPDYLIEIEAVAVAPAK